MQLRVRGIFQRDREEDAMALADSSELSLWQVGEEWEEGEVGLIIIKPSENHVKRVQLGCGESIVSSNCQTLRALAMKATQLLEPAK